MASRKNRKASQNRKRIVSERSSQARSNEAKRNIKSLKSYNERSLGKLTDSQLFSVAMQIGKENEIAKKNAIKQAQKQYYNVPRIRVTKRDRMFAERPDVTQAMIDNAPGKRKKLMRQQQKRISAAKNKIKRARQNELLQSKRTVEQQRRREIAGTDIDESGLPDRLLQGNSGLREMLTRKNVLRDKEFVGEMPTQMLIDEILDSAERLKKPNGGKGYRRKKTYDNVPPHKWGKKDSRQYKHYYNATMIARLNSISPELVKQYRHLSDRQKEFLDNATAFSQTVKAVTDSPVGFNINGVGVYEFSGNESDREKVITKLKDFMKQSTDYMQ